MLPKKIIYVIKTISGRFLELNYLKRLCWLVITCRLTKISERSKILDVFISWDKVLIGKQSGIKIEYLKCKFNNNL